MSNEKYSVGWREGRGVGIQVFVKKSQVSQGVEFICYKQIGWLVQGMGGWLKGTNTIFPLTNVSPVDRFKDVTYEKFICIVQPKQAELNQTLLTLAGNQINYPEDVQTPMMGR